MCEVVSGKCLRETALQVATSKVIFGGTTPPNLACRLTGKIEIGGASADDKLAKAISLIS
jgi:hypothetical protein